MTIAQNKVEERELSLPVDNECTRLEPFIAAQKCSPHMEH